MQINVELTDSQAFALDLVVADKTDWVTNFVFERARIAKDEVKQDPAWNEAVAAVATSGGNINDDWEILLKGKELGLFLTVNERASLQNLTPNA